MCISIILQTNHRATWPKFEKPTGALSFNAIFKHMHNQNYELNGAILIHFLFLLVSFCEVFTYDHYITYCTLSICSIWRNFYHVSWKLLQSQFNSQKSLLLIRIVTPTSPHIGSLKPFEEHHKISYAEVKFSLKLVHAGSKSHIHTQN